ncbi:MAG: bglS-2, partial [Acidimicrobiales bacterium]|nr:bglS-2 [Acidimicrobiales bacterium]
MIEADDHEVTGQLADLTLEERAALTGGDDMWHATGVPDAGIGRLKVSDGPVGVRGERTSGTSSTSFPCATALASSWDRDLLARVGRALGEEARAKGVHLLLGPTVNLHRHPLAGRNFECYSEDPLLTAELAVAYVLGVQGTGVGACIKHFAANEQETERMTVSAEVDERTLREMQLVPFEAAVLRADVAAVMSAYNKLNGTWCGEHPWLLTEVLRDGWGFDGFVISDWFGTHSTEALAAGLDLEMPGPPQHLGPKVAAAVEDGRLSAA